LFISVKYFVITQLVCESQYISAMQKSLENVLEFVYSADHA